MLMRVKWSPSGCWNFRWHCIASVAMPTGGSKKQLGATEIRHNTVSNGDRAKNKNKNKNRNLDICVRFLLGLSEKSNRSFVEEFLKLLDNSQDAPLKWEDDNKKTVDYITKRLRGASQECKITKGH